VRKKGKLTKKTQKTKLLIAAGRNPVALLAKAPKGSFKVKGKPGPGGIPGKRVAAA
jgi:hypothetical protein